MFTFLTWFLKEASEIFQHKEHNRKNNEKEKKRVVVVALEKARTNHHSSLPCSRSAPKGRALSNVQEIVIAVKIHNAVLWSHLKDGAY